MSGWKTARIVLIVAGFAAGFFQALYDPALQVYRLTYECFGIVGIACLVLLPVVVMPVALLMVIGIQAGNPLSAPRWTVPTWDSNFLSLRDPLHFFHMAALIGVSGGAGLLLCSPVAGVWALLGGASGLASSVSLLLSIRLCRKVFARKYETRPSA